MVKSNTIRSRGHKGDQVLDEHDIPSGGEDSSDSEVTDVEDLEHGSIEKGHKKSSGGLSFRVLFLLLVAVVMAYAGFIGGERVADFLAQEGADRTSKSGKLIGKFTPKIHELSDEDDESEEDSDLALDYPQLLHDYYKKHNPKFLGDVPMILSRYSGKEKELFAKLEKKYGEPVLDGKKAPVSKKRDSQEKEEEVEQINNHEKPKQKVATFITKDNDDDDDEEEEEEEIEEDNDAGQLVDDEDENARRVGDEEERDEDEDDDEDQQQEGGGVDNLNTMPDTGFDITQENKVLEDAQIMADASRGHLKIIGVGFPGTGLNQVYRYLSSVGGKLNMPKEGFVCQELGSALSRKVGTPEFNKFDSFGAIVDDCIALFYEELMATYPTSKLIITVRDINDWYDEIKGKTNEIMRDGIRAPFYQYLLRSNLTASAVSEEFMWKTAYHQFYERLFSRLPRMRRKIVSVYDATKWNGKTSFEWLPDFLVNANILELSSLAPPLTPQSDHGFSLSGNVEPYTGLHSFHMKGSTDGHLKVIGVGLDGTGEGALAAALHELRFSVAHFKTSSTMRYVTTSGSCRDCTKVKQNILQVLTGAIPRPNFGLNGVFHGVDAVVGSVNGIFLEETLRLNPDAKVILLVKRPSLWYKTVACWMRKRGSSSHKSHSHHGHKSHETHDFFQEVYGISSSNEYMFKKRYMEYVDMVQSIVPKDRLLILNLDLSSEGQSGYDSLCHFLRVNTCTNRVLYSSFPTVTKC